MCIDTFCNPTCKNTLYENGDPNKLPNGFIDKIKKEDAYKKLKIDLLFKIFINLRKKLYGTNTTIIKDGFYKKLSTSNIKKLKKDGALSGCTFKYIDK